MLVYLVMNMGAFLMVIVVAQATGSETIDAYKGLTIGMQTVMIYMLDYLVMNMGAFLVVIVVAQSG